jgi:CubicO group peptidase (beta-lactamase class C family)
MNTLTGFTPSGLISSKNLLAGLLLVALSCACCHPCCLAYADGKDNGSDRSALTDGDATAEGIDEEALQNLVRRAGETHSNALVIVKNGKLIGQWYFGHTIKAQALNSITKSICSLAIGRLIDEQKIASLETPIASYYPQWRSDSRRVVTLREILSHTSGLDEKAGSEAGDLVADALTAELKEKPGTKFIYNNRASNLLAGIVKMAAGKGLDQYINEKFFLLLSISDWHWNQDDAGAAPASGGLAMTALDLAKIGILVGDGGSYARQQLISKSWLSQSTGRPAMPKVSADYGLMWWLLPPGNPNSGACMARGFHGQYMVVLPAKRLVVVRQISEKAHKSEADDFTDLPELAMKLVN